MEKEITLEMHFEMKTWHAAVNNEFTNDVVSFLTAAVSLGLMCACVPTSGE